MAGKPLVAAIVGRAETPGLPVFYIMSVWDERGNRREVRRRYKDFAALMERISATCRNSLPKLPPPIPLAKCLCGMLDRREAALGTLLDALVSVAQRSGDDATEIRTFLKLPALRRSSSGGTVLSEKILATSTPLLPVSAEANKELDSLGNVSNALVLNKDYPGASLVTDPGGNQLLTPMPELIDANESPVTIAGSPLPDSESGPSPPAGSYAAASDIVPVEDGDAVESLSDRWLRAQIAAQTADAYGSLGKVADCPVVEGFVKRHAKAIDSFGKGSISSFSRSPTGGSNVAAKAADVDGCVAKQLNGMPPASSDGPPLLLGRLRR
jgi:hypothetical protein